MVLNAALGRHQSLVYVSASVFCFVLLRPDAVGDFTMDGGQIINGASSSRRGLGRGVSGGGVTRRGRSGRMRGRNAGIGRGHPHPHPHGKEGPKSKNRKWIREKEGEDLDDDMIVDDGQVNGVLVCHVYFLAICILMRLIPRRMLTSTVTRMRRAVNL